MTIRAGVIALLCCGLAACGQPRVPDSGPGAGFGDYNSYIHSRTSTQAPAPQSPAPVAPTASTGFSTSAASSAIDAAEAGSSGTAPPASGVSGNTPPLDPFAAADAPPAPPVASGERARGNAPAGIAETTAEMTFASGGVSDEQDFQAVKSRETIESDKARIEANRAQYVVIQPGALPQRPGDTGPNIAEYAIATNNPVGEPLYPRPSFYLTNPKTACARFTSPDLAQQAFLTAGGPQKDGKALDPDGDGFACAWDPRPFRNALK